MYDFASSGYTTLVITAVFNAYFVAVVGGVPWATLAWTATLSLSYALIVLTAPLHGAIADACAWKKRLLVATTLACVGATTLLWFADSGTPGLTVTAVIVSSWASAPART